MNTIVKEAEVVLAIAKTLEPFPKAKACAIMAGVCAQLGHYAEARRFIDLAERHAADAEVAAVFGAASEIAEAKAP